MHSDTGAHATARRAELFDNLVALFLADGFAHLTLDSIAAHLHCSKSTLYTLASSKDDLVRAATVHFFRQATREVEDAVARRAGTQNRITTYLSAVGRALAPASEQFMRDMSAFPPAMAVYHQNTTIAAERVQELLAEGLPNDIHTAFVADVAASTMVRIQNRQIQERTGLADSDAYRELAKLLTSGM